MSARNSSPPQVVLEPITSFKRSLEEVGFNLHRDGDERPLGTSILVESSDSETGTTFRTSIEARRLSASSSSGASDTPANGTSFYQSNSDRIYR